MEKIWELPAPVLVEADGARMFPAKRCRGRKNRLFKADPDSPFCMDSMPSDKGIKDCCFRPELVAQVLGKAVEEVLTEEDLAGLAVSAKGGKRMSCRKWISILY